MERGKFIGEVLVKYMAFVRESLSTTEDRRIVGRHFIWAYDTALANKPLFSVDSILWDYSGLLKVELTKDNYNTFNEDAYITPRKISTLSKEQAEEIMKNNILASIRLEQLQLKAQEYKEIMENT